MTGQKTKPAKQDGSTPDENEEPKKVKRTTLSGGVLHPVDRSYYDPKQDCVIDVIRVEKSVQDKKGNWSDIVIYRYQFCKDEEIQAKYRHKENVSIDVEVEVNG